MPPAASCRDSEHGAAREALAWFERPDMPVTLNLRTCCLALDLDVSLVQMVARQLARQQVARRRRHTPCL
jgi:hypothetical protein